MTQPKTPEEIVAKIATQYAIVYGQCAISLNAIDEIRLYGIQERRRAIEECAEIADRVAATMPLGPVGTFYWTDIVCKQVSYEIRKLMDREEK
jgi:hypothetical protein